MPPLSIMLKTVSSDCNLDCSYCYYRSLSKLVKKNHRISEPVLEVLVAQYMKYVADSHSASFNWQGGEPLLAGLDFFRNAISLETKYARAPIAISNSIQTNATLIDDEWAEFFSSYNFLVGVSLDGPERIHNSERKDHAGKGSFERVMRGIDMLRSHNVDFNVLCVVGQHNVRHAGELTNFYQSQHLTYLQFMPAMGFQSIEPHIRASYLITAEEYGQFLLELFDKWYGHGLPGFSVRMFDNLLQSALGLENDLCTLSGNCDSGLIVEHNGDLYPCDFYIHPDYKLGNIMTKNLKITMESDKLKEFRRNKTRMPGDCAVCEWLKLCHGECPRNRESAVDDSGGRSYFCNSYRYLFESAFDRINTLARKLQNYRRFLDWQNNPKAATLQEPSPDENCPCDSGLLYAECCGNSRQRDCYLFRLPKGEFVQQ